MSTYKRSSNGQIWLPDTGLGVLSFVEDFYEANGYGPSFREIMDGVGISSTSVVRYHVQRLSMLGLIRWQPGIPRSAVPAK